MKPNAPSNVRGSFNAIASRTPEFRICEHLPRLSQRSDKYCVIRTLYHPQNDHNGAHYIQTGHPMPPAERSPANVNAAPNDWPAMGSVVKYLDRRRPTLNSQLRLPAESPWRDSTRRDVRPARPVRRMAGSRIQRLGHQNPQAKARRQPVLSRLHRRRVEFPISRHATPPGDDARPAKSPPELTPAVRFIKADVERIDAGGELQRGLSGGLAVVDIRDDPKRVGHSPRIRCAPRPVRSASVRSVLTRRTPDGRSRSPLHHGCLGYAR